MIKTLRAKLLVGFTPLLAIMVSMGLWAVVMFHRLGGNIDVILRENYRSVLAAQGMKDSLGRINSAILFAFGGQEDRAREQFAEFRLVDQLMSDMVATVSHELRTPLTSIQMAVHLLLEEAVGPLDPKQVELRMAARQDSDRLMAMVNDILDLTRIEQGRVELDLEPIAPSDLIGLAIERFEAKAGDAGIGLAEDVPASLPPVLVDRERIDHVFDNLIGNALARTGRGGPIRLTAGAEGGIVRFAVADDGEGIPAESFPRVSERFYRVPGSRSGGAGLGLAIAREVVAGHGGQLDVESEIGRGTTFTFRLPTAPHGDGSAAAGGATS